MEEVVSRRSDEKKLNKKETTRKKRDIGPGGLMKAVIRSGEGTRCPKEGDQIIFHYITRTTEGVVMESSRHEFGGRGVPLRIVLGKSKVIAGWEEGITTMLKGEVAMLKIKPELHYGDPECPVKVPEDFPKHDELLFEIELCDFQKAKHTVLELDKAEVYTQAITEDFAVSKVVLREGEGWETARPPYEVKIWVTGRLLGGATFFSHKDGDPILIEFGKGQVPEGLEKAIGTMTRKEKSIIYISRAHCAATPNSLNLNLPSVAEELEFDVELVQLIQVRDMFGDGGLIKRRLRDGIGEFPVDCPLQDSVLRIHYKGMLPDEGGKVFLNTRDGGAPLEFASGEGVVPEGLEASLRLMLPGELAIINSVSKYAYDNFPRPESISEGASVQWEVELLEFETPRDWTDLNFQEIMAEADSIKVTGNRLFKDAKYELAKAKYDKVLRDFKHVNPHGDEEAQALDTNNKALLLNVAACYQKLNDYIKSIETCNKVLEGHPYHVKALYRRGMAYMETGDFEEARADFKQMIKIDKSSSTDATTALQKLKKKEQEAELKARKQFKGLFDKRPGELSQDGSEETLKKHPTQESLITKESPSVTQEKPEEEDDKEEYDMSQKATTRLRSLYKVGERFLRRFSNGKCTIL